MAKDNDHEDTSELEVSSLETRFVEREDDGETLWEVVEIVAERKNQYKVRWAGVNPETNEPWPLDWVPKEDCTDPLVIAWKRKKAEKRKKTSSRRKPVQSRASTSSRASAGSSATITRSTASRSSKPKPVAAGTKRKNDERIQSIESDTSRDTSPELVSSTHPRKKRKIIPEASSPGKSVSALNVKTKQSKPEALQQEEEESSDSEQNSASPGHHTKFRKQPPKTTITLNNSDSDEEPPQPEARKKDVSKTVPRKNTESAPRKKTDIITKLTPPTSRSASYVGSKRAAQRQSEDEEDVATIRRSSKSRNGASKKMRPADSESSGESLPPPPKRQAARPNPASTRSLPDSKRVSNPRSSTSNRIVKRQASPSSSSSSSLPPLPASSPPAPTQVSPSLPVANSSSPTSSPPSPPSPSTVTSSKLTDKGALHNGSANTNHLVSQKDDDYDSALEYADHSPQDPQPPSTPPPPPPKASTKPTLLFQPPSSSPSPSPPPSPPTSQGKSPEIVPETEAEESQDSQRRDIHLTRSPSKNSVVSKMKPRTPGSKKNIPDADIIASPLPFNNDSGSPRLRPKRALHPIPQISPSKFATLPSSTIESAETVRREEDPIEQFDSPDKSARGRRKDGKGRQDVPESSNESLPVPPAATDVIVKGVAMADAVKRAKQNGAPTQAKLPLATLIGKEKEKEKGRTQVAGSREEEEEDGGEKIEHSTLEEFADSFVDYDGGLGDGEGRDRDLSGTKDKGQSAAGLQQSNVDLRQEEEESTQDLLMELEQRLAVPDTNEGWTHPPPEASQQQQSGDEEMVDAVNSLEVAPKSSGPTMVTPQEQQTQPPSSSQRSPAKHSPDRSIDHSLEIPATMSPIRLVPELVSSQTQGGNHLESAMNLLNKKSEEISRLETLIQELQVDNANLKAASIAWQSERATLVASAEAAKERQALAEKDVDFFRELYGTQSNFVSELQAENKELQQRAEVAEAQATTGLQGIRSTFEMRIKQLEDDVTYHKRIATFVVEQSHRTGDEEIRRRAAEYPEMERKFAEMEKQREGMEEMLEGAREMIDVFEKQLVVKDRDNEALRAEKKKIQEEMDGMKREVDELRREVERLRDEGTVSGVDKQTTTLTNGTTATLEKVAGETQVYRCLWRKDGREHCDAMFLTKEDLQRHMEIGGHL